MEDQKQVSNENQKIIVQKSSKKTVVIATVVGIIIIALIGVVIYLLLNQPKEKLPDGRGTVVTPDNVDEVKAKLGQPVQDGYYETCMNVDWTFSTWDTPSEDAYIKNGTSNSRTIYVEVKVKNTNQLVYSSPYVPVGSELTKFALSSQLNAGDYPAVVTYHLVDENNNDVSTLNVNVTLHVLK